MFSLHKNYIKEQQKLINQLQEQIIKQNIKISELQTRNEIQNTLMPYFKQIAQIFSFYCSGESCAIGGNEGAELMLSVLDHCSFDENGVDSLILSGIEEKIRQWEVSIIERKRTLMEQEVDVDNSDSVAVESDFNYTIDDTMYDTNVNINEADSVSTEEQKVDISNMDQSVDTILDDIPPVNEKPVENIPDVKEVKPSTDTINEKPMTDNKLTEKTETKKSIVEDFGGIILVDDEE